MTYEQALEMAVAEARKHYNTYLVLDNGFGGYCVRMSELEPNASPAAVAEYSSECGQIVKVHEFAR